MHARTTRSKHNAVCNQMVPLPKGTQADHHTNLNVPADQKTTASTKPPPYMPHTLSRPSTPRSEIWYEGHTHTEEHPAATKDTHNKPLSTRRAQGMPTGALAQATQGMAKETAAADERTKVKQPSRFPEHAKPPHLPTYTNTL